MSISAIALSGMNAANASLESAAQRIARMSMRTAGDAATPMAGDVSPSLAPAASSDDRPEHDLVGLLQSKNAFLMNLSVFKTADAMTGALLDITE